MRPPLNSNSSDTSAPDADWLQPPAEEQGLAGYVRTLRERLWLILAIVAVTTGAAILYVVTATPTYEAEADMIIFPAAGSDQTLISLPLIRESSDPGTDVETAARLIENNEVAARVKAELDSPLTPTELLDQVSAEPIATSKVIAITATADSPEEASDLANAFATATIEERTDELHTYIDKILPGLEAQLDEQPNPELQQQLAQLQTLRESEDPTIQVQTAATPPSGPASPRKALEHRDRRARRPDPRHRRGLRDPDPRPEAAPRGAAAQALPAADPGADPPRERGLDGRPAEPARPLPRRRRVLSHPARDPGGVESQLRARIDRDPGHGVLALGGQDDDRDQPRHLARGRRQLGDPDRGRPATPGDRPRPERDPDARGWSGS